MTTFIGADQHRFARIRRCPMHCVSGLSWTLAAMDWEGPGRVTGQNRPDWAVGFLTRAT